MIQLDAVKVIEEYEMKRNEVLERDRFIKYYPNAAYLHPGEFGSDLDEYKSFIDSFLLKLITVNLKI